MKKRAYSFFVIIILSCFLSIPQIAFGNNDDVQAKQEFAQDNDIGYVQNDIHVDELESEPIDTSAVKKNVIPNTSNEGKKVIGLFLKTMAAVCFCAILLYIILFFAKRYYFKTFSSDSEEELEDLDLSTPNNRNDALKSFLNRTK